ncbi:hypothetical protein Rhe02_08650 [Rhizocola hellebori]|uniref:Transposase IS116/IS110/IS902 C-terminal domain-containing protein n=1 Tax=Rhizocola hellebori TaxID=1392758 RepID=A0A8J3Q3R2_9ACTN|nr:transposase [Rhizocola hellebori]GIH02798.1 hypothetical protein Rhe02_08650 [Rhizocola hellebori]
MLPAAYAGLGVIISARILAEMGDDRQRFGSARGLKAYAGSAPITKASGRALTITHRPNKNNRLNAAGILWASVTILHPGPERQHYLRRRAHGDRHVAAVRHLFNRMLGQLHRCLQAGQHFDQEVAYPEYFSPAVLEAIDLDGTADLSVNNLETSYLDRLAATH